MLSTLYMVYLLLHAIIKKISKMKSLDELYDLHIKEEVEHLGRGGANSERGGKHALIHVLAAEKNITPLNFWFSPNPTTHQL